MANCLIFYRTPTTRIIDVADPNNLPAGQKLLFTPPNDLASGIQEDYTNNIIRKIPPQPSGRRINQTDEGVAGWLITVEGNFIKGTGTSDSRIHNFRKLAQADTYHVHGVFGLKYPNGPAWLQAIDPNTTKGLMITFVRGKHVGLTKELVDFSMQFSYGGDIA